MEPEKNKLEGLQSEGDLNISPKRKDWIKKNIESQTQKWLELDAECFLLSVFQEQQKIFWQQQK